jgi:hypothetical protein
VQPHESARGNVAKSTFKLPPYDLSVIVNLPIRRKGRDDEKENTSQSRNATCKRRKKKKGAFDDILNQRLKEDKVAFEACSRREEEQHAQQMGILNKLADCVQGLNDRISGMQDEQEKTNRYLHQQELERREDAVRRREKELGIHM